MPVVPVTPASLQHAAELRRLAHRLQGLGVLTLHHLAGDDTWVGPAASTCRDDLLIHARRVNDDAERLLALARRIEYDLSAVP